jgi:tRNA (guanine-N7-)-methyltransferase
MSSQAKAQIPASTFHPPDWLRPLQWEEVFPAPQPVEVDIGCGKGSFLLWLASLRPDTNFLGVERQLGRLRKVEKKRRRLGLENVRLLRVEASYLLTRLVPEDSVSAYHINFPDPWPKRRHHQRRLVAAEFVTQLHRTLRQGGVVNVATDHDEYFVEIHKLMSTAAGFKQIEPLSLPEEARTEFERAFLAVGKPIYRGRWLKT